MALQCPGRSGARVRIDSLLTGDPLDSRPSCRFVRETRGVGGARGFLLRVTRARFRARKASRRASLQSIARDIHVSEHLWDAASDLGPNSPRHYLVDVLEAAANQLDSRDLSPDELNLVEEMMGKLGDKALDRDVVRSLDRRWSDLGISSLPRLDPERLLEAYSQALAEDESDPSRFT